MRKTMHGIEKKKLRTIDAIVGRGLRAEDIIKYLDEGGDVNQRDQNGETFLHAVTADDVAAIALLVSRGGDINARGYKGWTPLHYAVETDCNTTNREGRRATELPTTKVFIELGADESLLTDDGRTAREIAAGYGRAEALLYDAISRKQMK
jgi:ankyrin repeat protein